MSGVEPRHFSARAKMLTTAFHNQPQCTRSPRKDLHQWDLALWGSRRGSSLGHSDFSNMQLYLLVSPAYSPVRVKCKLPCKCHQALHDVVVSASLSDSCCCFVSFAIFGFVFISVSLIHYIRFCHTLRQLLVYTSVCQESQMPMRRGSLFAFSLLYSQQQGVIFKLLN